MTMEFTFSASPFSTVARHPLAATNASVAVVTSSEETGIHAAVETPPGQSLYERVSKKKEHGVGNTAQWRKRLINQIEGRVKDKRISIHNARRKGLQPSSFSQDPSLVSTSIHPPSGESATAAVVISDEEERRIIAEVWDSFKNENFEALSQAFQGMTDNEIEEIEQDILQYRYTTDYDPTYDMVVDMEKHDMDQTIEQYVRLERSYTSLAQEDQETAAAISLGMTLLSGAPCLQCHSGSLGLESLLGQGQAGKARVGCAACGFCVEKEGLLHIAGTARSHSEGCPGQVHFAYDEDTGLLVFCPQCDLLA